jgi:ABC-2 type transport system ATP-binding protein
MSAIACFNVSKVYGEHWAVRNLDFQIPSSSIFALVGPNGAGKSSTIKMLATLLEPTAGRVVIAGFDTQEAPEEVRRRVGYLPDHFTLYEEMSVARCLDFYGACFGMGRGERKARVGELLGMLDLSIKRDEPIKALSRGMKQRVGIARALLHRPPVLLLDEPASGLDPAARLRLRQLLLRLKEEEGLTILVSSHILTELSTFCDSVGIMQRGRMLAQGRLDEIEAKLGGGRLPLTLSIHRGQEVAERVLRERFGLQPERTSQGLRVIVDGRAEETALIVEALVRAGVALTGVERGQGDLEWVYTSISTDEVG